jgi:uncharacterized protein (DUF433 family)
MTDFTGDDEINGSDEWIARDEVSKIADLMLPDAPLLHWQRQLSKTEKEYTVVRSVKSVSADVLLSMRLTFAAHALKELVEIDSDKARGVPVLAGTRFKIARILAELADGMTVSKMAREFSLDKGKIVELLRNLAIQLDRPFSH